MEGGRGRRQRLPQVKNKSPAPVQITAEQIIFEAQERQDVEVKPPKQRITDPEELAEYRLRKRKEYEDKIRRQRNLMSAWIKYASWEDSQHEYDRARSIYERAIDVDYRNVTVWLKYVEMEMKHKNINHARNVWDRAVTLLPRVNQFWYKYIHMEDILGNFAAARQIFERWMEWEPDEQAWSAYIKFEIRNQEIERARAVFDRFVACHPSPHIWVRRAKFEQKLGETDRARKVYEEAIETLGELADASLFIAFAKFEERSREYDRAREIYKYALDNVPKGKAQELYKLFIAFEKQYGDRNEIENVIVAKRRFQYEDQIKVNPRNYDIWFDYLRLEETNGMNIDRIREVFERAIANVPPTEEKRFWRRYIYLWINYAIFEEIHANDFARARQVYQQCVKVIPHKVFSFSKIWVMYAHFEIRQKDVSAARQVLGQAIGMAPKPKIFDEYIQLELRLAEFARCRKLYTKYVELFPYNCNAWVKFAELEKYLEEYTRARLIFELATEQQQLDKPELLWKAYIDFEIELEENEKARQLYQRLLERTKHVKVWISYAQFEKSIGAIAEAREVYDRAYKYLKPEELKEERVMLVESWKAFEEEVGEKEMIEKVEALMPQRIRKKKPMQTEDGTITGYEEYYDYIFPDEPSAMPNLKLLERAHLWKKRKLESEQ